MVKNIIAFALNRPILNHILLAFILMLSVFSYMKIPKEIFPISALNAISIKGVYIGASSDMLDLLAVDKIEDDLANINELDKITTVVKSGSFNIKATIKDGYKVSDVLDQIKDIISNVKQDLPSDMNEPTVSEVSIAFPLVSVAVSSNNPKNDLLQISKDLKKRLLKLADLSTISIYGDSDKQLLITLDEQKIDAYGLNKSLVISTISQLSSIFPAGKIKDNSLGTHYYLSSQNGVKDIVKIRNTILKIGSQELYLKDIADIEYRLKDIQTISHFNANKNIAIGINKGRSGDSIALVKQIKEILKDEQSKYKDVTFATYLDTSVWIKNRLNTVVSNIIFGIILLSIALLFFINSRIAFVVAVGIPTSFMIGLISAEYLGHSLNMLSLLGALLALGMLVDEAIVVGENIYRHLEMGKSKYDAALDGAYEMFPAVLTATATTIFAFLPILMMSGETGVFLRILPVMISVLILSSLFEAFYFLPLHALHTFKVNNTQEEKESFWTKIKNLYGNFLEYLLKSKYISLIILLSSIIFLTVFLAKQSKFEFMPEFDTTQIYISASIGAGHSLEQTQEEVYKIERKLLKNFELGSEIDSMSSVVGLKLDGKQLPQLQEFYFQIFVNLKEAKPVNLFDRFINPILSPKYDATDMTREQTAKSIAKQIKVVLKEDISNPLFVELSVKVPGAGIVKNDIEMAFSGDSKSVRDTIDNIKKEMKKIKGVNNIVDDILLGNYDLKFSVTDYGLSLGFNETNIVNELKPYYFKASYSKMYDESGIVNIVFQSKNKDIKSSLDNFELTIPNTSNKININDVVVFTKTPSLSEILKEDGIKIQSITASLEDITSDEVYDILNKYLENLPKGIEVKIKGEQEENKKVKMEMSQAFIIALVLIFISLVVMFDSLMKSFLILSTIPLSILGVLIGHIIMDINITMPGVIGVIGLAGVIVNDGIIMMDFIQKAKSIQEVKDYALLRLRPIILTSFTTILGLSSLIFFASGQALILQPMAISLGFGVLWATVLNLYYLPLIYSTIYLRKSK